MEEKAQLLEAVMTPRMRLRLLVNQVRRRGDCRADGHVDRVVNQAVKRVRRAARTPDTSKFGIRLEQAFQQAVKAAKRKA